MKLSNREKNMILIFGLALIGVAIYFFVVEPIHQANNAAKEEYQIVDAQYRMVKTQVKDDSEIDTIIGDYRDRLSYLESKLPAQVYLEKIIDDIFSHFISYDITLEAVTFNLLESKVDEVNEITDGELAVENLRPVMSVEEILNSYEAGEDMVDSVVVGEEVILVNYENIGYMNVSLSFSGNYEIFKDSLEGLSLMDMTVFPTNMSLSKAPFEEDEVNPDNNQVYVALSVAIPFYYDNEPLEDIFFDYEFEPGSDFEEHGPFEYTSISNIEAGSGGINTKISDVNGDFILNIRNSASDLAAQSMAFGSETDSVLELDSNQNERYTLDIVESNGVVSFKYKNAASSYPASSGYKSINVSGDNIIVKVNSSGRFNNDDDSALTMVLNNQSTKKVLIYVFNDDVANPRFNVIVNNGSFDIIRN